MNMEAHFDISDSAAKRIAFLLAEENHPGGVFRVAVDGGGCSGFQYRFNIDVAAQPEDKLFRKGEAVVAVDEISLGLLGGSQIDYVETLAGSSFEIKNPNATSGCGCGNSFSVA